MEIAAESQTYNLRHSLSKWLVNKAKVEPKTVQCILRHAKIQTTLDLYTQEDSDETRATHGEFLSAVGMNATVHQLLEMCRHAAGRNRGNYRLEESSGVD